MCLRDILSAIQGVNPSQPNLKQTPRDTFLIQTNGPVLYVFVLLSGGIYSLMMSTTHFICLLG